MAEGLTVNPHPTAIPDDWIAAYQQFRTALLGHVTDDGFVDEKIRLLARAPSEPVRVVGTAVTARLPDGDLEALVPAVDLLQPGDVLVVDHGGRESLACWGELTSLAARARGCVGVVVDGAIANLAEIAEHGLPTFARAVAARGGRTLGQGGSVNVPVQCGGVSVHPGDLVVADDDGVVVLPPRLMVEVAALAAPLYQRGPLARAWLERGGTLGEIAGLDGPGIQRLLTSRGQG
ncbi:MAG: RraA family protein [Chloroflexi bacterium]|nr:RraA family protein [Chloroflexota bacterium]